MTEKIKFITRDDVTENFEKAIYVLHEKVEDLNSSFHPSWFKQCNRRIIFKTRGYFLSLDSYCEKKKKELLKLKWLDFLSRCKGIRLVKDTVCAADKNYKVAGYVDAVVDINDLICAVTVKGIDNDSFKTVVKQGASSQDVIELVIYLWLLELKNGILIYDNLNDGEFHTFHVVNFKPIIESVKYKCLNLIKFQNTNQLPERAYKDNSSKECIACEFNKQCWRD